ncbi:MAG: hypothetical protein ACR2I7_08455 [Geodermatophilaceae bacterium]
MQHLQVSVPVEHTDAVLDVLRDCSGLATLAVLRGASQRPIGDLILADLARESVDCVVHALRRLDVDAYGAIAIMDVDTSISAAAHKAERDAPGEGADAVIWEQVVRSADDQSRMSWTFLGFLTIAALIASIPIVLDSSVLLIGGVLRRVDHRRIGEFSAAKPPLLPMINLDRRVSSCRWGAGRSGFRCRVPS